MTAIDVSAIPRPRYRFPVLGDVLAIDFVRPVQGLTAEIHKAGDHIFEERLLNVSITAVADTALIDEVNNEAVWEKHNGRLIGKLRPLGGDGLFTAFNDEPNWQRAHNILSPAFVKSAMMRYHHAMVAAVGEFVDTWTSHAADGSWVDVSTFTNRLATEVIARAGLSHSFDSAGGARVLDAIARELRYANRRTDSIPFFDGTIGYKRKRQHLDDTAFIRGHIAELIAGRRRNPTDGADDLIDTMLHHADPDSGQQLDDDNVVNQVLTMLVAGSETSANTTAFALHFLATHPEVAGQARAEVDQIWPDSACPAPDFGDVAKMRYLRRVVDETLRLWPTAPGYFRQARRDTTLGGKYVFRQGDWVLVLLTAAHRSPAWGPDADEFNPDRFLPENLHSLPPHTYRPFGTGARACIGRQFALHEIVLTLATVLHQYDLAPDPDYELEVYEAVTLKPANLRLRVHKRRP
ncbi:cytochrome P450 [Mycobacterium sp. 1245111.1]|uniref:cytochrome P450 n=1 Tax=Mycobacterium sp. 1245111.1 TaxID=1834073 RepID=UPI000AF0B398|nr:cytochrome P450 [Mycobacterium sp. 1245111.1]